MEFVENATVCWFFPLVAPAWNYTWIFAYLCNVLMHAWELCSYVHVCTRRRVLVYVCICVYSRDLERSRWVMKTIRWFLSYFRAERDVLFSCSLRNIVQVSSSFSFFVYILVTILSLFLKVLSFIVLPCYDREIGRVVRQKLTRVKEKKKNRKKQLTKIVRSFDAKMP